MIQFVNKNINPKGRKTGDCVVRALAVATGREYLDVYSELFYISIKTGYIVNDKRTQEKFLLNNGFVKHKQPKKLNGKKYLVGEIDKLTNDAVVVVSCAHHVTVALNGAIIDTWDCRGKCISNYYTLQK